VPNDANHYGAMPRRSQRLRGIAVATFYLNLIAEYNRINILNMNELISEN